MSISKYVVNQYTVQNILNWVQMGEIAIPEIQRPFVWKPSKVRDLIDSLYNGYPVGYIIVWRNHAVKLKDGTKSEGKKILIDGQQRIMALMTALLGDKVVTNEYKRVPIKIAFSPKEKKFEVKNVAIDKDDSWINDISTIMPVDVNLFNITKEYCSKNKDVNEAEIFDTLNNLKGILNNSIGVIELNADIDIETVTEIFIRINSQGIPLSQADFAMSKIASNETYGGNTLRKCIDYFCHLSRDSEIYKQIDENDVDFKQTQYFNKIRWIKDYNDILYKPLYTDVLRVAFTSEFKRGRLQDLVALLSGRNFETRTYEEVIVEKSFNILKEGVLNFINESNYKKFLMIIKSAGFIAPSMITSKNTLDFAYVLYLYLRKQGMDQGLIEKYVKRWYVMSVLTGRYSSSPESQFDIDIRRIDELGIEKYLTDTENAYLSDAFWNVGLPQNMDKSVDSSPYFKVYLAAQVKNNDKGFLSKNILVQDLIIDKGDVHHIFPKEYLKKNGINKSKYNQIANYVLMQSEINIAIRDKAPNDYINEIINQCNGGRLKYGSIDNMKELMENFKMHCIPQDIKNYAINEYDEFLNKRRKLMALKIKEYYFKL